MDATAVQSLQERIKYARNTVQTLGRILNTAQDDRKAVLQSQLHAQECYLSELLETAVRHGVEAG